MSAGVTRAATLFEEGVSQFKAGNYSLSARTLANAVAVRPTSQLARYYLACALVKSKEHRRAVEEYRVAYLLDPASATGEYCRKALLAYKAAIPDQKESERVRAELARQAAATPANKSSDVATSVNAIRRETDFRKNKHKVDEQQREKIVRGLADAELKRIDQQMAEQIAHLSDPIVFGIDGARANPLLIYPELMKEREDQIRKAAQEEKERILRALEEKADRYKGIQKHRDSALDEVAENLESQMVEPARGGVRLQPVGTGLYVRNYLPANTRPPAEVRGAVGRIVNEGQGSDSSYQPTTEKKVTGSVRPSFREPVQESRVVNGKLMLPN